MLILIIFSSYSIFISLISIRTDDSYNISSAVRNVFENRPYGNKTSLFKDIKSKWEVLQFGYNILLPQIYDPNTKSNGEFKDGYHYVADYNYFMGMRMTLNLADLSSDFKYFDTFKDFVRKDNYQGRTDKRYDKLFKGEYINTTYTKTGGYDGKGGYVYYAADNLTLEQADNIILEPLFDGLIDNRIVT